MGLKMDSGVYIGTKGSIISSVSFLSRRDAINGDYNAPSKATEKIRDFFRKSTTNHFTDFKVSSNKDGTFTAVGDNPGRVPGSHATYVKVVSPLGKTLDMYKTTYDNNNKFVHKKGKIGGKK